MSYIYKAMHRIHSTQDITYMRDTNNTRTIGKQTLIFVHHQFATIIHRYHTQLDPFTFLKQLPTHNIGMVLHFAQNHFISFTHKCFAETRSDKIDTFCSTTCEDYL